MARKCDISKKKGLVGNRVSHSKRHTKHIQQANLQWKSFWDPARRVWVRLRVSTKMIKTIGKKGLQAVIKKQVG